MQVKCVWKNCALLKSKEHHCCAATLPDRVMKEMGKIARVRGWEGGVTTEDCAYCFNSNSHI